MLQNPPLGSRPLLCTFTRSHRQPVRPSGPLDAAPGVTPPSLGPQTAPSSAHREGPGGRGTAGARTGMARGRPGPDQHLRGYHSPGEMPVGAGRVGGLVGHQV